MFFDSAAGAKITLVQSSFSMAQPSATPALVRRAELLVCGVGSDTRVTDDGTVSPLIRNPCPI